MTNLLFWIASLIKRKPSIRPALASAVRCVAGRPAKTTSGLVAAGMSGTRSTREECAPPACTSGLKPNAHRAADGRHIRSGMQNERATATFIAPNDKPVKDR